MICSKVLENNIRGLLKELVEIPSVNPGNLEICDNSIFGESNYVRFVSHLMEEKGYYCSVDEVLPGRPNLIIRTSKNIGNKPIILLQTHSDVVGVDGMEEPFRAHLDESKLWGRGSCDAKGQLCTMILTLDLLKPIINDLPFDICIALCCDEEYQHRGVDKFLDWEFRNLVKLAIVGEPTELKLASACKGSIRFSVETKGIAAHTSMPEKGVNAIYLMAKIINLVDEKIIPEYEEKIDEKCGKATIAVSLIEGGNVVNAVPDHCIIHIDRRMIPYENWEEVYTYIKSVILDDLSKEEKKRVIFNNPYLIDPSYKSKLPATLEAQVQDVMIRHNLSSEIIGLPYGCDASKIAKWQIPVFVFGPGSIKQAHTKKEYIEIQEIIEAILTLKDLILSFAKEK